jgi:hypothetical protein
VRFLCYSISHQWIARAAADESPSSVRHLDWYSSRASCQICHSSPITLTSCCSCDLDASPVSDKRGISLHQTNRAVFQFRHILDKCDFMDRLFSVLVFRMFPFISARHVQSLFECEPHLGNAREKQSHRSWWMCMPGLCSLLFQLTEIGRICLLTLLVVVWIRCFRRLTQPERLLTN